MVIQWNPVTKVGSNSTAPADRYTNTSSVPIDFIEFRVFDINTGERVLDDVITCDATFPYTVNPHAMYPAVNVIFSPEEAIQYSRWFQLIVYIPAHDGWAAMTLPDVSMFIYGLGVAVPITSLSIQPLSLVFPDTLVGANSSAKEILIINTSEKTTVPAPIQITGITCNNQFSLAENTSLPHTLQAGNSLLLHAAFSPQARGNHSTNEGLLITTDQGNNNNTEYRVAFVGYSYLTAIAPMSGFDDATLLAFAYGSIGVDSNNNNNNEEVVVSVKQADPDNLNTEEIQLTDKSLMFGESGIDKIITGLYFKYEDIGAASLAVTISCRTTKDDIEHTQQKGVVLGSNLADTLPLNARATGFTLDAETLRVRLYKDANTGPLSVIETTYQYLVEKKLVGSLTMPRVTDGVGILGTGSLDKTFAAFHTSTYVEGNNNNNNNNGYYTGNVACRLFNENNFNCEENVTFEKLTAFELDVQEKAVMRTWLRCEDIGASNMILDIISPHNNSSANSNATFGNNSGDILTVPFDTIVSGELLKFQFSHNANTGPLSITGYIAKVEPRGELVKP